MAKVRIVEPLLEQWGGIGPASTSLPVLTRLYSFHHSRRYILELIARLLMVAIKTGKPARADIACAAPEGADLMHGVILRVRIKNQLS